MKTSTLPIVCFLLMFSLSGCGLMEDAFKAGLFFGLIIVAIIALLVWVLRFGINMLTKKGIMKLSE
ncbi:MAG: hypothetical protein JWP94_1785 [Mucilaginibacter sp.]|jgi:hypothetical protein|nr:hypothetical protein [Mucilaginibacter sp.]